MSIDELFGNKALLLRCPTSVWETILYARYLMLFSGHSNTIYLEDIHDLKPLLESVTPAVTVIPSDEVGKCPYEIEYHLSKLHWLYKKAGFLTASIPYLRPSGTCVMKFREQLGHAPGMKCGVALHDCDGNSAADISDLFLNLPRHKLRPTFFYHISSPENKLESLSFWGPHLVNTAESIRDYHDIAALVVCLDCVITFDQAIAHIAGAMDKLVWLLVPDTPDDVNKASVFEKFYHNVTVFRQQPGESWRDVFLKILLHRLLLPAEHDCDFSNDEKHIDQEIRTMSSVIEIRDTDDLIKLVDTPTPSFVNVVIETTTVCNLRCSYCPNSTVWKTGSIYG